MNSEWKEYLINNGAELVEGIVTSFGNIEQERHLVSSGHSMCDLSHLAVIEVSGADSATFLQSQLTNDVESLALGESQLDGWCTPKGRLLVLMRLVRTATDRFLLLFPREMAEETIRRLRMFIFRSQVEIHDRSEELVRIGLAGPQAEELLTAVAEPTPPAMLDQGVVTDRCTIVRLPPAPHSRFLVITNPTAARKIWSHFDVQAAPVGRGAWELLKIRAGIPSIYLETREEFVPQMVNLQQVNGLSFTKGCYPGQEVVARMEYLGKLKRQLFQVFLPEEAFPTVGAPLYSGSSRSRQGAGRLVSVEKGGDGTWEGLAVIELTAVEANDLTLDESRNVAVTIIS